MSDTAAIRSAMITMPQNTLIHNRQSLLSHGIRNANAVWWDLSTPALYEHALQRREGRLAHMGPLVVSTGQYTGRSPNDKYLVEEPSSHHKIWWGRVNQPISIERFDALRSRLMAYLQGKDIYVQDCYVGADENYRLPIRIITETAWHSLFARNMFLLERDPDRLAVHQPQFTVIDAPGFNANPEEDGTRSEVFVAIHFGRREVIIGGTMYAGEIKKSVFTVMNYLLPEMSVLPMHCSANFAGSMDDVAIFFGLSGTGKTTLSADRSRTLIGDDEHGWSDQGVFNFEGGCYAKVIRLSPEGEPDIFGTTRRFGTILENVAMDPVSRRLDLNSSEFTENTRASYPVSYISNATREGRGRAAKERGHAHRRRLRRVAAASALDAATGDVPFPLGLHGESGRHGARHHGTQGHVQRLFWCALHGAESGGLCPNVGRPDRRTPRQSLAHQYRLEWRTVWERLSGEAGLHSRHGACRVERRPGWGVDGGGPGFRVGHSGALPWRAGGNPRSPLHLGGHGRLRRSGSETGEHVSLKLPAIRRRRRTRDRRRRPEARHLTPPACSARPPAGLGKLPRRLRYNRIISL